MKDKEKPFIKNNNLNQKLNICYLTTLNQPIFQPIIDNEKNKNDEKDNENPIFMLLSNFEEIQNILKIDNLNYLKFFYFNKIKTHEILYDKEKLITINDKNVNSKFYLYFYLSLLIEENNNVVNYQYSYDLIKNINEIQKREKDKIIKKVILAKIIIDLISNYEQLSDNDENFNNYENELNSIKILNQEIIKKNENNYKKFDLSENDILKMKIDEIYAQIIKTLKKKKKLVDLEYTNDIISEIGLESINITKTIFNVLRNTLDKEKDYMKEYIISNYEDLFNMNIIMFYYILLKYILKCNIYIYEIPFLLETRNNIRKIIKKNIEEFHPSIKRLNQSNKDKIEYVLGAFIPFNWFFNKSLNIIQNKSMNNSQFISLSSNPAERQSKQNNTNYNNDNGNNSNYEAFSAQSYQNEKENNSGRNIDSYEELKSEYEILVENSKNELPFQILQKSEFNINVINKDNKALITYNEIIIKNDNEIINKNIDDVKKMSSKNKVLNDNYQKFISILNEIENKIENEASHNFDYKIILKFTLDNVANSIIIMTCESFLIIGDDDFNYRDDNILANGLIQGFPFLINQINNYNTED